MSDSFKALVLNQEGENFNREIKSIDKTFLKHGDVLVKVEYSGLNFKDALILKNGARLVKEFPHIPGIDFSGKVEESQNNKFKQEIIDNSLEDEHPRLGVTIENLSKLKAAFKKNGTVTAGNSSGINDGSAAVQL